MKKFAILCAATIVVASLAVTVKAGEISQSTLGSMGLGSMHQMSDNDGLAIRGKGAIAYVYGQSTASVPGASSTNGYSAISSHRYGAFAIGANISAALIISPYGSALTVAGGASAAFAK